MSPSDAFDFPTLLHSIGGGSPAGVTAGALNDARDLNGVYTCKVAQGTRVDSTGLCQSSKYSQQIHIRCL